MTAVLHWSAVALAAGGAWLLLRLLRDWTPGPASLPFEAVVKPRRARAAQLPDLEVEERRISFSSWLASDFHARLRPVLREIAGNRLAVHRAVDLELQPEAARGLLGEAAWDALQPGAEPPADRRARGPSLAEIDRMLRALEAL
jgi:hypothetical protein